MASLSCCIFSDFLDTSSKSDLNHIFDRSGKEVSPYRLMQKFSVSYEDAFYILLILDNLNLCEIYLEVYHNCSSLPIKRLVYGSGFPELPFVCESCLNEVSSSESLRYNFIAITKELINFI
jgi:hypothetical protein